MTNPCPTCGRCEVTDKDIKAIVDYYFKTDEFGNTKLRGVYKMSMFVAAILQRLRGNQ